MPLATTVPSRGVTHVRRSRRFALCSRAALFASSRTPLTALFAQLISSFDPCCCCNRLDSRSASTDAVAVVRFALSSTAAADDSAEMSGIFHSLKKTLVKGDARPDVEFLDAKTRFEQYSEVRGCMRHRPSLLRQTQRRVERSAVSLADTPISHMPLCCAHFSVLCCAALCFLLCSANRSAALLLCQTLIKLKGNITNYLSHATALYINSSQIAQDFTTLIEDPDIKAENEYTASVVSCRQEHQTLAQEMVPKLQNIFSTQILAQIDEECVRNSEIAKRITRRIELFSELGYYQRKVNELRSEREARAGKGKPESASDIDKFQRNQKKLGQ